MSTTTRPVTQTAEVAVKRAFTGLVSWPVLLDMGSISKMVPSAIMAAKPYINIKGDELVAFGRGITESGTCHGLVLDGRKNLSPGLGLCLSCMSLLYYLCISCLKFRVHFVLPLTRALQNGYLRPG